MTTTTETQPQTRSVCILTGADHESAQDCSTHRHRIESVPATIETPTITLSNFRVSYHAPRYEDGRVLYDGYCAILADSAEHDGAEVRVFDVPDVDEGQLAAALFACDAMNRHDQLISLIKQLREFACLSTWSGSLKKRSLAQEAEKLVKQIDDALATTTSK